ncbi:MAG: CpsD/CapB family tyrosine-protein kinase [bacterium]|nr:CpsD/CapB family tyrosine-protein kinase [bacterium]
MGEIAEALRRADGANPIGQKERSAENLPRATPGPRDDRADAVGSADHPPHSPLPTGVTKETRIGRSIQSLRHERDDPAPPARISISNPQGNAAQTARRLAFRVRELADARGARSIVVTSAQQGDGKTTTACNLAIQLAGLDQTLNVVLVDLDLRRPDIASALGVEIETPVDGVLRGDHSVSEAIIETDVTGLSLLALDRGVHDAERLLAHPNLPKMIRDLESRFDLVLLDSPPLLAVTDAQLILRHAAAALFVARAGSTTVRAVRRTVELLPRKKILGSFLNSNPKAQRLTGYDHYGSPPHDPIDPPADPNDDD